MKKRVLAISLGLVMMFSGVLSVSANSSIQSSSVSGQESYYGNLGWTYPLYPQYRRLSSWYLSRANHYGIDIVAAYGNINNAPVFAAQDGVVVHSYYQTIYNYTCPITGELVINNGYGYAITIMTQDKKYLTSNHSLMYTYEHFISPPQNSSGTTLVAGNSITQGFLVGRVGSTGCSTGPHLHFEIVTDYSNAPNPNWYSLSQSNTVDPVYFYPNVPFIYGYNSPSTISNNDKTISDNVENEFLYKIDASLIEYVGVDEFTKWIEKNRGVMNLTVVDFLNNFNISTEQAEKIVESYELPFYISKEQVKFYDYELLARLR